MPEAGPGWVDDALLAGPADEVCLVFDAPVTRAQLRALVAARQADQASAGLVAGGTVALRMAPSLAFVAHLLAAWRTGAQAVLLDHRLTDYEIERALDRLAVQVVVHGRPTGTGALRGFYQVAETVTARPQGRPAATAHAVVQLSSGSTGPSKVIGRTAQDLLTEVKRYTLIEGVPRAGERIVSMASMVHVLGLVGGLLYGLHAHVQLTVPERVTPDAIMETVAAGPEPTTLLGVPFHIELLASVARPPKLPQLTGMTTGGELVRAAVYESFVDRYGIRLGNMYGMTEVGVIATDLFGTNRPAVMPAPGLTVREEGGELHISRPESPYLGDSDPARWSDGWLHTRDAGTVDEITGLFRVLGRRDSQVSVGGLKVDLSEVEHTLAALPAVEAAVVTYGRTSIEAYITLVGGASDAGLAGVTEELAARLAPFKRPRVWHLLDAMPRTATGKLVRDVNALAEAAEASAAAAAARATVP